MRNPLSKTIVEIEPSGIRKFFDIVSEMQDAISLGVGEPDFDTPWRVRDEAIYSLERGRTFYTSNAGLKELKVEIANYLHRRFDLEYDYRDEILVTVGGSEAIDIALRTMLDPGDEVLIPNIHVSLIWWIKSIFSQLILFVKIRNCNRGRFSIISVTRHLQYPPQLTCCY